MTHEFGGIWTEHKLTALRKYMAAYATILGKKKFRFAFIDAFAGSGERQSSPKRDTGQVAMFEEERAFALGSAQIALECSPPFDKYFFVEKRKDFVAQLGELRDRYPALADRVEIKREEANTFLQGLTDPHKSWKENRALVFLDPYGMNVDWTTVAGLAATKAIDLWYLFPFGIGLNRLVTRSGKFQPGWEKRITRLLGVPRSVWEPAFYEEVEVERTLFDDATTVRQKVTLEAIAQFVVKRLESIFPKVAPPLWLRNSSGNPLYLLCFAAANPEAADLACGIADDILKKLSKDEGLG